MEGTGHKGQGFEIFLGLKDIHLGQFIAQGGDIRGSGVIHDGGERQHFEGVADGVDLLDILDGKGADHDATAHDIFDKAIAFQLAERFTQGSTADVETVCVIGFDDPLAGGNLTGDDCLFEDIVRDLADRTAFRHRFKGQSHNIIPPEFIKCIKAHKMYKLCTLDTIYNKSTEKSTETRIFGR